MLKLIVIVNFTKVGQKMDAKINMYKLQSYSQIQPAVLTDNGIQSFDNTP